MSDRTITTREQSWELRWRRASASAAISYPPEAGIVEMLDRDYEALVAWGRNNPTKKDQRK